MATSRVHLDPAVLKDLQDLAARSGENLNHLLNRLLREALDRRRAQPVHPEIDFASRWITKDMKPKYPDFWQQAKNMRERLQDRKHSDSAEVSRELRDCVLGTQ